MKKVNKFIYWTPRILSIVFILFIAMFSLDVFDEKLGFLGTLLGLFMHNIPVFILIIFLITAWKHEIVGAVAFAIAGLAYIILLFTTRNFQWFMLSWIFIIAGPAFLISWLFWINWRNKKR
jgi:hypothetical protein